MNSKQRVMGTFNHEKVDRVPVDYATNPTIHAKVKAALGVTDAGLYEAFGIDFRGTLVPYKGENHFRQIEGTQVDPIYGFYTKWVENEFGGYMDFCNFPLQDASEEEIYNFYVPSPDDFDYSFIEEYCKANKEYAIYCGHAGMADVINATGRVMGMEDTLVNLLTGDQATLDYINRRTEMELGQLERIIWAAKGQIDFLWMGEDLGTQHSPMISLELYRKVMRPIHQRYIDLAKSYNLPVMVHTCGSSSWVYDDFIEMGVNAVDTLQPEADNMSPQYLAQHFGTKLAFHGCISTAGPLAYGTVEELKAQLLNTLEIMKPYRGYMMSPTHAIQDNTPVENVIALYKMAREYGTY
ncbi:MAG: hypothetical protein HPZ00_01020 [Christensenellaceae bacterium]|nr:hypothetical protein [Christensenellaceae bacterium]